MKDKIWCKNWQLTTNKFLEIQLTWWKETNVYFTFHTNWSKRTDHAGFEFRIDIHRLFFCFLIYDHRHWDDETNSFKIYELKETEETDIERAISGSD